MYPPLLAVILEALQLLKTTMLRAVTARKNNNEDWVALQFSRWPLFMVQTIGLVVLNFYTNKMTFYVMNNRKILETPTKQDDFMPNKLTDITIIKFSSNSL